MKISTIRSRILLIFLGSVTLTSVTFLTTYNYFSKNEHNLWDLNRKIDLSNHFLLRDIKVTRDFFSNETINSSYFETGKSDYLSEHQAISNNFLTLLSEIKEQQAKSEFGLDEQIAQLEADYDLYSRAIDSIIATINVRGFKDHGLEGRMRGYVHKLEELGDKIGKESVLSLRKHEKDFIIRQDTMYRGRLHQQAAALREKIASNHTLSAQTKELYNNYLTQYESKFDSLVYLESLIGLKKQSGLKKLIDAQAEKIDRVLGEIHQSSFEKSVESLNNLRQLLGLVLLLIALGGTVLVIWISERISRSAIFLKAKIMEFIDSDFSKKMSLPVKESKYEIDILTYQFTVLEQHIQDQMNTLKLKNEELENTFSELKKRYNDMLQFNYIVSHNFRAPVANLIGLSDLAAAENKSEEEKQQVIQFIQASVHKIDASLKDLNSILSFRSSVNIEKEEVIISALLKQIIETYKQENGEFDASILIDVSDDADTICTVKAYLESILYNLVSNAFKYRSPKRTLELTIAVSQQGTYTTVGISDNGIGIDLDRHGKNIFGLYKRFHPSVEGKGLGLYMCKTQVETLGGTIGVESKPGQSATFTITLPNS